VLAGPATCSAQDVTATQALLQTALARYQAGLVSIADVDSSTVLAAEVQFCAGQTAPADFCAAVTTALADLVSVRTIQYQNGAATIDQIVGARKALLEKRAFCGAP
jgi:hypothetical protein